MSIPVFLPLSPFIMRFSTPALGRMLFLAVSRSMTFETGPRAFTTPETSNVFRLPLRVIYAVPIEAVYSLGASLTIMSETGKPGRKSLPSLTEMILGTFAVPGSG